VQCALE